MEKIAVWFSNGAASAVALQETIKKYGTTHEIRALNSPVIEEDEDNLRFAADVERWLGVRIERVTNSRFPAASAAEVWDWSNGMSFPHGASCTLELKKQARYDWERVNKPDWHVLGFPLEEKRRHDQFVLSERSNVLPILIWKRLTKQDCYRRIQSAGITLPRLYHMGYPNANCIGCVKSASPTYWNLVRRTFPLVFDARAEQSRRLGSRLVIHKGKRIFLDELPPDARGMKLRGAMECGVFCEERR